jgi:hypothetical protein
VAETDGPCRFEPDPVALTPTLFVSPHPAPCAVVAWQPDVVCLQEVDDKVFAEYLAPHLALAGYGGAYTNKQGRVREGSAMFWRKSRLQLAARHDVLLRVRISSIWGSMAPNGYTFLHKPAPSWCSAAQGVRVHGGGASETLPLLSLLNLVLGCRQRVGSYIIPGLH